MKLQYKLYFFFVGVVILPLLVATVAASIILSRSGTETYESRINSALAAASVIVSGQEQVLAGDFQQALKSTDVPALGGSDATARTNALTALMNQTGAQGALISDAAGGIVTSSGSTNGEAPPMLASSTGLPIAGGGQWQLNVFRELGADALESIFNSQGLQWGLISDSAMVPADTLASTLDIPKEVINKKTVLWAGVTNDVVGAASGQALKVGIGLMALVAVLAGVMGYLLARTITSPLRQLTDAASAGSRGDLESRVDVRSQDEIGSLATSFNQMQDNLQKYILDLEESRTQLLLALSYAGDILGSTSDRNRLMKVTAEAARLATGADAIWAELFESREPPGHQAVSAGVPAVFFEDERRAAVHRFCREIASGEAPAGEVAGWDSGYQILGYPMLHDKKMLGVLAAVYPEGVQLEESSRKIISSLAIQAASALKNVSTSDLQRLLSLTDPMTGLSNFRYLSSYIDREMKKSRRYEHNLTLAILDLDDFKKVNDEYGHPVGDTLLKAVGETLLGSIRSVDMVARYGGEEFAAVFPETGKAAVMGVLEKLRREVAAMTMPGFPKIRMTVSIGVASFPEDAHDKNSLLIRADQALYVSKAEGKNRVTAA